jgi:hypothetical protein
MEQGYQPKPRVTLKTNDGAGSSIRGSTRLEACVIKHDTRQGSGIDGIVQELADRVTAGLVEALSGMSPRKRAELKDVLIRVGVP